MSHEFPRKDAKRVTNDFLRWLRGQQDRPFFAFLNYFDAHFPYRLPESLYGKFGPPAGGYPPGEIEQPTPELYQPWENVYDGAIAYIDQQLGVIFDTLAEQGLLERTIVVVTSDHGESFGEHGQAFHYSSLYATELRVPLVISFPGNVPNGVRVTDPVTLRDLPATVLQLAGIGDGSPLPGRSLAGYWTPNRTAEEHSPVLAEVDVSEWAMPWSRVSRGDMKSLFDGPMHYILNGDGVEELYDLDHDPHEQQDLSTAPDLLPVVQSFRSSMSSVLRKGSGGAPSRGQ